MNQSVAGLFLQLLEICWINLLLSGDNAVVIALACRGLPPERRRIGILLGAGAAVVLRVAFTAMVVTLLDLPFLKLVGGVLLIWIAADLVVDDPGEKQVKTAPTIWGAVRIIALADAVMSLDNVIAIAAAARGNLWLITFGLLLSVPLIVFGATLVMRALERLPWLAWAGAALLGFVSGELIAGDPFVAARIHHIAWLQEWMAGLAGTALVLLIAIVFHRRASAAEGD